MRSRRLGNRVTGYSINASAAVGYLLLSSQGQPIDATIRGVPLALAPLEVGPYLSKGGTRTLLDPCYRRLCAQLGRDTCK